MSLPDLDILEVKSVSDMISVFETPADDAAKLIGEDDVAIFSPQLDLMIVTSQYDLEEPVTTSQTVILSVADAECTWPDPPEYVSDIVFECRWPSGANLVTSSRPSPTRMPRPRHPSSTTVSVLPKAEPAWSSLNMMKRTCSI